MGDDLHLRQGKGGLTALAHIEALLETAVEATREALAAAKCSLMVLDEPGQLVIRKASGLDGAVVDGTRVPIGDGIAGWVALNRKPILAAGLRDHPELSRAHSSAYTTSSFVSVPVMTGDAVAGVLNAADKQDGGTFGEDDLRVVEHMASVFSAVLTTQGAVEELHELNLVDPLTGLGNRRFLDLRLAQELSRARRYEQPLSLLLVGVQGADNPSAAILVAPETLQQVESFFQRSLRRSDVVARYGEAEFAILLPQATAELAELVGGRLLRAAAREVTPEGETPFLAHAGISSFPALAFDEEQLISQASAALSSAGESESQNVLVWQPPTDHLVVAQRLGIPYLQSPIETLTPEIAGLVPLGFARRHHCVPVGQERGKVTVAMLDPTDRELLNKLAAVTHLKVHPVISTRPEIAVALGRMAELCDKQVVVEISRSPKAVGEVELQMVVKPLMPRADVGRFRRELLEVCRQAGCEIRRGDSYAIVVNALAGLTAAVVSSIREIQGVLFEDVVPEGLVL